VLVAELYRAAVRNGSKHPNLDVHAELSSRGIRRACGTVRNDVCHAWARALIPPPGEDVDAQAAEDTTYAQPLLDADARPVEVARWRMGDGVPR
jgi:hypothetical protein